MPDLPPVKVKVEVSTDELAKGEAETKAFSEGVKRDLEPAGQAFIKFADNGDIAQVRVSSATAKTRQDLDKLAERAKTFGGSMDTDMRKGMDAMIKLGDNGSASIQKLTRDFGPLQASAEQVSSTLAGMGPVGWLVAAAIAGIAGELSLVLVPLAGFVVGLTAAVITIGLFLGVLGVLSFGIVALAAHANGWAQAAANLTTANANLTTATKAHDAAVRSLYEAEVALQGSRNVTQSQLLHIQDLQAKVTETANALAQAQKDQAAAAAAADNPFTHLVTDLQNMASVLGQQATPAAQQILTLLDTYIPEIRNMLSGVISWFTDRLPAIIPLATKIINDFLTQLQITGQGVGKWFDNVLNNSTDFESLIRNIFGKTGDTVLGLLNNLAGLAKWFMDNLPTMQGEADATFSALGKMVQGVGTALGDLVLAYDHLDTAIGKTYQQVMTLLKPALEEIQKHQEVVTVATWALYAVLVLLGGALVAPLIGFALMGVAIVGLTAATLWLWDRLTDFWRWLTGLIFEGVVQGWKLLGTVLDDIASAAGRAEGAVSSLWDKISHSPPAQAISAAGSAIQNLIPHASGGNMVPGRAYRVGEQGPETVLMGAGSAIVLPNAGQSGGAQTLTLQMVSTLVLDGQVLGRWVDTRHDLRLSDLLAST